MDHDKSGIYLVQPKGQILRPIDLDKRRIDKVVKVNEDFIKFGKSERPFSLRYYDYKKIFGKDVKFEAIIVLFDVVKLREFEKIVSSSFNDYKISNPNSSRKLEWMHNISFENAKKKILNCFNEFKNNN